MKNLDKLGLRNENLRILELSIKKAFSSDITPLDKTRLIFKLVDTLGITQSEAKEYLEIIQTRHLIEIQGNAIYPKEIKEKQKMAEKEFDNIFKKIVEEEK